MTPGPDAASDPPLVLIVDDERHNRQLLEVMLGPEGYRLATATCGEEALALVARQPPDLILLDIMMPGMNGYDVASRIKGSAATRNIPVIMVTAFDDRDARMLGLNAGAEDFLTKPVDRAELCVRVRNLLRLKAYGEYYDKHSRRLEGELGSRTADLEESERLYRETFDAAPVGIVHVGLDGRWLRVNHRLCALLGYSREELQSPDVRARVESEEAPGEAESFRRLAGGSAERGVIEEKRYRRKDGGVVWVRVNVSAHRDAGGRVQHFVAVVEDITERRSLEAQVRQASKMDAIGRLASGVAHDFNNLLTVILGFAEIVAADVAMAKQHANDLSEIIKAAQRATGLTKQLLAFSREQVLDAAPVDVNGLITEMTGMLGRLIGENIAITLVLAPDLSPALSDRGQLEQVVMNLVVNARDAMPDGGSVTIETSNVELESSPFHEEAIQAGRYAMLAITDTGSGMSKEIQRRLFEPFFTTKEAGRGTGLGLSTTYGIVKQSKGHVWVYSEPGLGTTFKVYLPRADRVVGPEALEPVIHAAAGAASETVLLVEDEDAVREFSRRILVGAGYRVLEATDGIDAEQQFARHAEAIRLVVTDVVMPGCGGPELIGRLRSRDPVLKALLMSGYTEQAAAHAAGVYGGLPFVQKPFTAAQLVRQVREALDG